jgi:hypothetical protein
MLPCEMPPSVVQGVESAEKTASSKVQPCADNPFPIDLQLEFPGRSA